MNKLSFVKNSLIRSYRKFVKPSDEFDISFLVFTRKNLTDQIGLTKKTTTIKGTSDWLKTRTKSFQNLFLDPVNVLILMNRTSEMHSSQCAK